MSPEASSAVPAARPAGPLTPDGRPVQRITSYARRGNRLTPRQQAAWDQHAAAWLIPSQEVVVATAGKDAGGGPASAPLDQERWFGRKAPLVVEIGSGVGEAVAPLAAARPDHDVLALEVWRPGVASTFARLAHEGAGNVRLLELDAVWALEHLFVAGQLAELWTFFPDPWPKKRHHKRRLITPAVAALAASRLAAGAAWRLATDWPDYAEAMVEVLDAEPGLSGGPCERWADRPLTKFERRGRAEGRPVVDLCYRRTS